MESARRPARRSLQKICLAWRAASLRNSPQRSSPASIRPSVTISWDVPRKKQGRTGADSTARALGVWCHGDTDAGSAAWQGIGEPGSTTIRHRVRLFSLHPTEQQPVSSVPFLLTARVIRRAKYMTAAKTSRMVRALSITRITVSPFLSIPYPYPSLLSLPP